MIETLKTIPDFIDQRLPKNIWQDRRQTHQQTISKIVDPYLKSKQHQHKNPVLDFLFEYYAFRPSYLKRWSPGLGLFLEKADKQTAPEIAELIITEKGCYLDPAHFPENRKSSVHWILSLLQNSLKKEPSFGCFGMHEWAMIYKAKSVRHNQFPLRLSHKELAEFVESRPLVCTHFDAFRFFTPEAKPMNKFDLSRKNFHKTEQAGCLHTNMDLYKWGFKLFPWISSDTIRRAFLLALDTRIVDMKASPYDLNSRGLEPIKIETKAGRMEYVDQQRAIYRRSVPVRRQLIYEYQKLITCW
jgi:hypothetical protein